jgi:hypothetical protein
MNFKFSIPNSFKSVTQEKGINFVLFNIFFISPLLFQNSQAKYNHHTFL